jgi:hypothetical protein
MSVFLYSFSIRCASLPLSFGYRGAQFENENGSQWDTALIRRYKTTGRELFYFK